MYRFEYHRPSSREAVEELLRSRPSPTLLAGGQTLLPVLKLRLANPSDLIDLGGIDAMKGVREDGGAIVVGAMTTHCEVSQSSLVAARLPALGRLAGLIGDPQVRHRGTIGGSVANNDPAADYPAACLGLGATIYTNRRGIAADDYFLGMFKTALEEGEFITSVSFPVPEMAAYVKFPNPASRFALVGVMVSQGPGGIRVAVTGGGAAGVFRDSTIEAALGVDFVADAVIESGMDESYLISDIHASAEYRRHLIGLMTRRAVNAATR